ncbi:MAG: hypothetical protein CVV47_06980 [Spirochaetae bacterium HGW-Spirochaetae-3]|jgi:uncharacterized protein (DUF2461 family)|nr:MAG: hypothetical protein CVV47_06980 [Spirochaetae bacterium HGW-Spirochaetae-3]
MNELTFTDVDQYRDWIDEHKDYHVETLYTPLPILVDWTRPLIIRVENNSITLIEYTQAGNVRLVVEKDIGTVVDI